MSIVQSISPRHHIIHEMQEELFATMGEGWFRIVTGSMRPLLNPGDRIHVKRAGAVEIRARDVILFKGENNVFITHRVLKVSEKNGKQMILQRGDAGGIPSPVPSEWIIGKVIAVEKHGIYSPINKGKLGMLNRFLGLKSSSTRLFGTTIIQLKHQLRKKPYFPCLRFFYLSLKWPFVILNNTIVRLFIS
jgi:signal peptidase I